MTEPSSHSEDLIELHFGVSFSVQLLNVDDVALLHAVLLTAGNDDCVHVFHPFLCTRWPSRQARTRAISGAYAKRLI